MSSRGVRRRVGLSVRRVGADEFGRDVNAKGRARVGNPAHNSFPAPTPLTYHRPRVTQHYPFGCLCYMLTYHPRTKVAQRGVRCLNFGRAETQPGYLCFDGSRLHVTPHCSMVPGCFPGLTRKAGGGLMVPEPKLGVSHSEVTSEEQATEQPQRDADTPTDGSTGALESYRHR
jgi:hypothetical protein